jgi:gamma-glutamyltranspeptidase/glutathione hydrolase
LSIASHLKPLRVLLAIASIVVTSCATHGTLASERAVVATVTAANPLAVEAGVEILRKGGSAVDAAIAVQTTLGLVEPQSSGIGGGAFLLHYDAQTGRVTALDGREKAPLAATPDMFLDDSGKPLPLRQAIWSGRSTGVPGIISLLASAHRRFGRLPWNASFEPAIRTASNGFTVSPRMAEFLKLSTRSKETSDIVALFARPDGSVVQSGDMFRNPAYAQTLARIAKEGATAFYRGEVAAGIVNRTREPPLPGTMSLEDLSSYEAAWVEPICGTYRVYRVCVPPPPSSGVSLLQFLAILDRTDIAERGPADPQAWYLFAEASRLMFADRDRYVADPRFVSVPVKGLLDKKYVAQRAALIGERAGPPPSAGTPSGVKRREDATAEVEGTSHFVVVDSEGDVVTMTTTVESFFGSGRVVGGFVLNNQLTDFSLSPTDANGVVANAVAGGKRPRSSMAPVVVLDQEGRLVAALGSPGGSAILDYNAKALVGVLAWELPMQQSIDLPNLIARGNEYFGEVTKFPNAVLDGLRARGVELQAGRGEASGLHGVRVRADGTFDGGADPRREGVVRDVSAPIP